jgi:hypothetical protein
MLVFICYLNLKVKDATINRMITEFHNKLCSSPTVYKIINGEVIATVSTRNLKFGGLIV